MAANNDKLIEQIGNMSVLELSQLVKDLKEKFDISDMPMMAAPAAAPAASGEAVAAAEEKSEYKVTLKDGGPEKIKSIKALRSVVPTLSLGDAKKAVEEAPSVISEKASKDDAKKIKEAMEAAGAKVELS